MRNKKSVACPQQHREIVMRRKRYHEPQTQNGGELKGVVVRKETAN
jgi:hypothetical protein